VRASAAALRARTSDEARRPFPPHPFGTVRFSALRASPVARDASSIASVAAVATFSAAC